MKARLEKRLLCLLLCVVMLIGILPVTAFADENIHADHSFSITHVEAQAGNCTQPGNIEFWYCNYYTCRKYYFDSAMTQEISPADTIITPGPHSDACVGCAHSKEEKTFRHFVPADQPEYDEDFYFWSNGGFYNTFSERLKGSTFVFVGEYNGRLYAMGNVTNPDGSRQAVDITDKVSQDGSVTLDSDTVEFFAYKNIPYTYTFSPDNGYMSVMDGEIVVRSQAMHDLRDDLDFPQAIRFEQDKELDDYNEGKGYLFAWDLNSGLILFDTTDGQPKFAPVPSWSSETGSNCAHNVMLYEARCTHAHLEHTAATAATCEENGNVEYWYCENCDKYYADAQGTTVLEEVTIDALGHDWGEWTVVTPASENEDGLKRCVCKNDSTHVWEESFHFTVYTPAVPASCTECGRIGYWFCDDCYQYFSDDHEGNEVYEDQLTARATGHKFNGEGVCEHCGMQKPVYRQVSSLAEFDQLSEDAYFLFVFKDGDKTYAARLLGENPYWADWNYDYEYDLFVVDENANEIPDCIETVDLDGNGVLDYLEDQDDDEEIGTYNDYFRIYENLAYETDMELVSTPNFVEVTLAADGTITLTDEDAMELQMMKGGVWGYQSFWEEQFVYDCEHYGITENERIRAAWVPNYWVGASGLMGYYSTEHFITQNRIYGDKESPGIQDHKNWKISFRDDGTACLVNTWESFDDTGALQLAKYTDDEGNAAMTIVGLPEWLWSDSSIMTNRTELLPGYLFASEAVYSQDTHVCQFQNWQDNGDGTHTGTCECGKTETDSHLYEGTQGQDPTCTEDGFAEFGCIDCGHTYRDVIPATGHTYEGTQGQDPTCTEDGFAEFGCIDCGHTYREVIPATGHTYEGTQGQDPTCTEDGFAEFGCIDCGHTYRDVIPATGHDYDSEVVPPTETEQGYTNHTCGNCGHSYQDEFVPAQAPAAVIGGLPYNTIGEALAEAQPGDTVELRSDVDASGETLILRPGVTLHLGAYDLIADGFIGFNGSILDATRYSATGDYGKLIVPKENLVLSGGQAAVNGEYDVIPVWNGEDAYILANALVNDTEGEYGLKIDEENKTIRFSFVHKVGGSANNAFFKDGTGDNALKIIIRLEWASGNGVAYQDFVYNDDFVGLVSGGGYNYSFILNHYDILNIDISNLKVTAMILTDAGTITAGQAWTQANAIE